jgi:hypothetical protein
MLKGLVSTLENLIVFGLYYNRYRRVVNRAIGIVGLKIGTLMLRQKRKHESEAAV